MNKKILSLVLTGVLSASLLVGCKAKDNSAGSDKLIISTWGLNEDVLKKEIFEPFAEEHGVEVVLEVGNNSDRLTKMKNNPNSNIDITYLAESFSEQGIEAGIFEKLDYSKIPNAQKINEKAKYTVENGYGPAYTLNSIGIVVDPTSNIEINSWEDLWKPELKGKIAIPDITTTNGAAVVDIAATKAGVDEVIKEAGKMLTEIPLMDLEIPEEERYVEEEKRFTYEINVEEGEEYNTYVVTGSFVDRLLASVNIHDADSLRYFHKVLNNKGVLQQIREMGVQDGDMVRLNDFEFEYIL